MTWDAIKLIPMLSLMILSCEGGVESSSSCLVITAVNPVPPVERGYDLDKSLNYLSEI